MDMKISATQIVNYFYPIKTPKWKLALKEGDRAEKLARMKNEWLKEMEYQVRVEREVVLSDFDVLVVGVIDFLDRKNKKIYDTKLHRPFSRKVLEKMIKRYTLQLSIYRWILNDGSYELKIIEVSEDGEIVYMYDIDPLDFQEVEEYLSKYIYARSLLGF